MCIVYKFKDAGILLQQEQNILLWPQFPNDNMCIIFLIVNGNVETKFVCFWRGGGGGGGGGGD